MMNVIKNDTHVKLDSQQSGHFAISGNQAISKRRTVLHCFHVRITLVVPLYKIIHHGRVYCLYPYPEMAHT